LQEADDKPVKIDKWDSSALKNALDDAAKKVRISVLLYFSYLIYILVNSWFING